MGPLYKNRHFNRLDEHYVKIGNRNILIQPNSDTLKLLNDYLGDTENQVIHIFELYPISIRNLLSAICTSVHSSSKIVIHIPHMLKDYVRLVKPDIDKLGRKVKFITERKEVRFKYYEHGYSKYFRLSFDKDERNYYIHTYEEVKTYGLSKSQYSLCNNNSVRTRPQLEYPEMFKDEIIKNFKKSNPRGIVETFEDDEDIWNFFIVEGLIKIKENTEDEEIEVMIENIKEV